MAITERGRLVFGTLTEHGHVVTGSLTERGQMVTAATVGGVPYLVSLADAVSISDVINKRLTVTVIDTLPTSDEKSESGSKTLVDSVSSNDSISSQRGKAINLSDSVFVAESINKALTKLQSDILATSDTESETITKSFADTLDITDIISATRGKSVLLNDSIAIVDSIRKSLNISKSDSVTTSEIEHDSSSKFLQDVIIPTDALVFTNGKTILLSDYINISESLLKSISHVHIDTVSVTDNYYKKFDVRLYDVIVTTEVFSNYLPSAPSLIGTINLNGSQELYVYLKASRNLNVDLKGGL